MSGPGAGYPGEILKAACDAAMSDEELRPRSVDGHIVTYCNQAAERVALALGCSDLCARMADEQYAVLASGGRWRKSTGQEATIHALGGSLAFAALPGSRLGEAHGHIAAVYPVGMQYSGSLRRDVPMVANVGKTNAVMKASGAFPISRGEPDYFCWA